LGLGFAVITSVVGDYLAPLAEREAVRLKASFRGGLELGRTGAWLKERRVGPNGERAISVNVARTGAGSELQGIRIFELDTDGRLRTRIEARSGRVDRAAVWHLEQVLRTDWPTPEQAATGAAVTVERLPSLEWSSTLTADVVAAAVLPLNTMSTIE